MIHLDLNIWQVIAFLIVWVIPSVWLFQDWREKRRKQANCQHHFSMEYEGWRSVTKVCSKCDKEVKTLK